MLAPSFAPATPSRPFAPATPSPSFARSLARPGARPAPTV
ncbi:hypothetical protein BN2537_3451 [Streptomyces venezuelae]|nr:hypothetical protein BN2537_3451 [Streptomyces venezuelae]